MISVWPCVNWVCAVFACVGVDLLRRTLMHRTVDLRPAVEQVAGSRWHAWRDGENTQEETVTICVIVRMCHAGGVWRCVLSPPPQSHHINRWISEIAQW